MPPHPTLFPLAGEEEHVKPTPSAAGEGPAPAATQREMAIDYRPAGTQLFAPRDLGYDPGDLGADPAPRRRRPRSRVLSRRRSARVCGRGARVDGKKLCTGWIAPPGSLGLDVDLGDDGAVFLADAAALAPSSMVRNVPLTISAR